MYVNLNWKSEEGFLTITEWRLHDAFDFQGTGFHSNDPAAGFLNI